MDSKNSAEVRVTADVKSELGSNATTASVLVEEVDEKNCPRKEEKACSVSASASTSYLCSRSSLIQGDESESKREESINPSSREIDKTRKSSAHLKSSSGNRKVKVDWTPELHRKFVQAVEQLGVDKAVPSKILELMGIDCLTRHNVASHLQKYRSHRKHILAREAKSTSWSWRQQKCGTSGKRDKDAWVVPTTGFPPVTPSPHFRPLHVWGYPSVDQSLLYKWPQPPPPPPLSTDPQFWYYHHQDVPPQGMPCFIPHVSTTMYPAPPVPGIPPTSMYSTYPSVRVPTIIKEQTMPMHPCDFHPSKESIDTVIGDVLSKPWLPLPLGLKPPSTESVLVELQNLGISKIPPAASGSSSEFAGQEKNHSI